MNAKKMREFVNLTEGQSPPVFVGREKPIAAVQKAVSRIQDASNCGIPKNSIVVQGAPGAGKSALLAELAKRTGPGNARQPRLVLLHSENLMGSLAGVFKAIGVAGGMVGDAWRKAGKRTSVGVNVPFLQVAQEISWPADTVPSDLDELSAQFPASKWDRPVIVAVDEAQKLPGNKIEPHALFLQAIHNASTGLPLSLVLAGLGDTAGRAMDMGLTRGLETHAIGTLSRDDVNELLRDFCAHFGFDATGQDERLAALAEPCEGWPRHLHFALQALGREALATEGDLDKIDWPAVMGEAAESRQRYYAAQQSEIMENSKGLIAAALQVTPGAGAVHGAERGVILGAIKAAVRDDDDSGFGLPEGMTRQDMFRHMVHRGALQKRADKTFHCPIPSFRTYLLEAGGLDPDARLDLFAPGPERGPKTPSKVKSPKNDGDGGLGDGRP